MPRPKRHHFVPQWYLERFTDRKSSVLHAYDKTTETYSTPKKNVMVIKDYNRQKHTPEGIDPDILETMLGSSLEPEAQRAFKKLLSQPAELTPDDSARLLTYLEVQRICYHGITATSIEDSKGNGSHSSHFFCDLHRMA